MKKILGALAAALALGAGCAHNQEKTAQTEVPSAPQASVESASQGQGSTVTLSGLDCEVLSTGGSGMMQNEPSASVTTGSGTQPSERVPGEASASAVQNDAIGASVSEKVEAGFAGSLDVVPENSADVAIGGADTQDVAVGGSASADVAKGGAVSEELNTGSAAPEDEAFEDTDMGGTGGGGG